jgi:hypothetical protein
MGRKEDRLSTRRLKFQVSTHYSEVSQITLCYLWVEIKPFRQLQPLHQDAEISMGTHILEYALKNDNPRKAEKSLLQLKLL